MTPLLLGLAITLAAPAPKETPKEPPKLEGDWIVESFEGGGEKGPPGSITMQFTADKVNVREGKREKAEEAGYTVDLKAKPATIDIRPGRGAGDKVVKGIIEINGDSMKLCFTKDGDRPTEFKADDAKRIVFLTLKRAKAEK